MSESQIDNNFESPLQRENSYNIKDREALLAKVKRLKVMGYDFFTRPNLLYLDNNDAPILTLGNLSTCFALFSLMNSDYEIEKTLHKWEIPTVLKKFKDSLEEDKNSWKHSHIQWPYDVYTTPFKLIVLYKIYENDGTIPPFEDLKANIITAICELIKNLQNKNDVEKKVARFSSDHDYSGFLSYWVFEALYLWKEIPNFPETNDQALNMQSISKDIKKKYQNFLPSNEVLNEVFFNIYDWAKDQLYRQLAYHQYDDKDRIDPVRSIYCLLIYSRIHELIKRNRFDIKDNAVIKGYNDRLVYSLTKKIFSEIKDYGLWKKHLPIVTITDNGSVYPFALSSVSMLLNNIKFNDKETFSDFLSIIDDILVWIKSNVKIKHKPRTKLNFRVNVPLSGWRSPHSNNPLSHPECWSTALTFDATMRIERKVTELLNEQIIFQLQNNATNIDREKYIDNFRKRDDSLFKIRAPKALSLKKTLYHFIIKPQLEKRNEDRNDKIFNSIILYGPPGTGKTSLTKEIASILNWKYLRVDTSVFLREGFDKITLSTTLAFDSLMHLKKTVILFDEIDEYIRNREDDKSSELNRMLTNVFLTKLNDLKENRDIIYFIATNHADKVDSAISREGRFDLFIPVNHRHYEIFLTRELPKIYDDNSLNDQHRDLISSDVKRIIDTINEDDDFKHVRISFSSEDYNILLNTYKNNIPYLNTVCLDDRNEKINEKIKEVLKDIKQKKTNGKDHINGEKNKLTHVESRIPSLSEVEIKEILYNGNSNYLIEMNQLLKRNEKKSYRF